MTDVTTRAYGAHRAYLDVLTGCGLLTRPRPAEDVRLDGPSLHEADWNEAVRDLDRHGWEPLEEDDGLPVLDGYTLDGCEVVGLYGREPVHEDVDLDALARSTAALHEAAGVLPDAACS